LDNISPVVLKVIQNQSRLVNNHFRVIDIVFAQPKKKIEKEKNCRLDI
jgi:hypothetical protein